ncbi:Re/Si-specific NAD(P)(+) transhydrogenase subunit alpha [Nitrospinae bacterium AH_259_B05_G02_I21]|nr:Re/Si-specific NAD(P)(+) transhydrogenase subunit alpha [Nitrospinae bacterium AH_259_B05_G02_I21]
MKFGIPKEIAGGETRVAVVPKMVAQLKKGGGDVLVQSGAGQAASYSDAEYEEAGATIVGDAPSLYAEADIVLKVQPPGMNEDVGKHEVEMMKPGSTFIGFLAPVSNQDVVNQMVEKKITSFSMEFVPRIARAQSMDALSSMASIAGYQAVILAAQHLGKFFPLMMTAAGTIPPARVLILGAGVAGLQAIATAKRLGARVEAFDVRPAVREQVESLGAQFVEMEFEEDAEAAGGYAKEMSEEFLLKEREIIGGRLARIDAVISTAQVFGKQAPVLITEEMVKQMSEGSVIVDLAAEQGGNCELTEAGKDVVRDGVTICGPLNLPAALPIDASQMYSKNVTTLVRSLYAEDDGSLDFEDEITQSACITHNGEIVNAMVKEAFQKG